jgi:hypothetical protein
MNPKTFALACQEERTINCLKKLQRICFTWRYWNEVYQPTCLADVRNSKTGTPYISPPNLLYWRLEKNIKHYHGYCKNSGDEEQTACKRLQNKLFSTSPNSRLATRPWPTYLHELSFINHPCQEHLHLSHSKSACQTPS